MLECLFLVDRAQADCLRQCLLLLLYSPSGPKDSLPQQLTSQPRLLESHSSKPEFSSLAFMHAGRKNRGHERTPSPSAAGPGRPADRQHRSLCGWHTGQRGGAQAVSATMQVRAPKRSNLSALTASWQDFSKSRSRHAPLATSPAHEKAPPRAASQWVGSNGFPSTPR